MCKYLEVLDQQLLELDAVRTHTRRWAVDCGNRVKARRELLGWDRRQLATLIGSTEATIARIELGQLHPRDHLKLAVSTAMQVEAEDLWPYPRRSEVFAAARS